MVSFTYNVGIDEPKGFNRSNVRRLVNENKYRTGDVKQRKAAIDAIEKAFGEHKYSKGVVLDVLVKRRKIEADLFLKSARAELAELEKAAASKPSGAQHPMGWQPRLPGQWPIIPKL